MLPRNRAVPRRLNGSGVNSIDIPLIAHAMLLVMLIFSDSIGSEIYSGIVLAYALVLTIFFEPVYLIVPCFLTSTIQSYFLITPTLSFSRILSVFFVLGYLLHRKPIELRRSPTPFLILFMLYHLSTYFWSVANDYKEPVSFAIGILTIILMNSEPASEMILAKLTRLFYFMSYSFGVFIVFLSIRMKNQLRATQVVFDDELNANTICSTLALFVAIIYANTLFSKRLKPVKYAFIGLCAVTILIVGSRTALIGVLGIILLLPFLSGKSKSMNIGRFLGTVSLISALVGLLYFYMLQNPELYARFTFESSTTISIDRRVYIWDALWNHIIPQHPWLGIGYGLNNVRRAVAPYVDLVFHSHNMYLAILSETGIVGSVMYGYFYFWIGKLGIRHRNVYTAMAFAIIILGLIIGIGEEVINRRWFWLAFGLLLFYARNTKADAAELARRQKKASKKKVRRFHGEKGLKAV